MLGAQWQAFFVAAVVMAVTPGANQLLSLRNALRQGFWDAVVALSGRFAAFLILVAATAAGLGALLLASEAAFTAVKWCGVGYLLFLGGRMIYDSFPSVEGNEREARPNPPALPTRQSRWHLTRQEFLVAMTNPKALLLFAAFLPQFADYGAGAVPLQLAALGVAYIAVEFVAALAYAAVGGRVGAVSLTDRAHRLFDRATGGTMIAIAGWLAVERR
ncbi:LysE family translocator [Spiractinospora alimapuensis]|uniref:LysE family translocator n=1 Tax=Spiractinospora alimapuensis TaxID=2820884 RepID=UPI001F2F2977|nr:LysE family translocator [Spiractinospora alimapuensis]QVQ50813.1 LysE family translocator [Spiractinospora alimapuensis]